MKITNADKKVLHRINYGRYESPSDVVLNSVLRTQFIVKDPPAEAFELLRGELAKVDTTSNYKYYEFIVGQLSYLKSLNGQYQEASESLLTNLKEEKSIKTIYLYCTYLLQLRDADALKKTVDLLSANFVKYPDQSKILERHYLVQLLDQLYELAKGLAFADLLKLFHNNYNLIISVLSYWQHKYERSYLPELQKYILEINSKFAKRKLPKAAEIDNEIEDFVVTLCQNNEFYKPLSTKFMKEIVISSFTKTFQNLRILKQYIILLIQSGETDKIEPTFEVYNEYIEQSRAQHHGQYIDILDIIDVFTKVLKHLIHTNAEMYVSVVQKTASKLLEMLKLVIEEADLTYTNDETISFLNNKVSALPGFCDLLSESWFALGIAHGYIAKHRSTTPNELTLHLSQAVLYFQNCLNSNEAVVADHYFHCAMTYAKLDKLKTAIKLMKLCCLAEKENLKYWNFLTLLYSTEENFKSAETLINNSILLANTKLEDEHYLQHASLEEKHDLLQLKLTQVSLIELLNKDTSVALECLPEVFQIFHKLFQTADSKLDATLSRTTSNKSKRNNALKRMLSKNQTKQQRQSEQLPTTTPKTLEDRLLQKLWLWTCNIFLKAGLYDEAENCLVEAEAAYEINSDTHAKFGMLLLHTNRLKLALEEFEAALRMDDTNLEAVLGLSKLVLTTEENDILFVSEKDKEAAQLRLRTLLEPLRCDYRYCQVTEVYWFLSLLHEKYEDLDEYQTCLWMCVELEENKPVRDFNCLYLS